MVYILLLPPATEQSRSNSKYTMNQWRSTSKKDILNPTQKQKQNAGLLFREQVNINLVLALI